MSETQPTTSERADAYVLGLMDEAERRTLEAELDGDAALQSAIGESRDRFLELDLAGPTAAVSPDLWTRIERGLEVSVATPAEPVPIAAAAKPPATPQDTRKSANENQVSLWRRMAFSATAASALLIAGLAYTLINRPAPEVIAILLNDRGEPIVLIEDFSNEAARVTPLVDVIVPNDSSLQVWTLPSKEMGPVSLGVLEGWRRVNLDVPDLPGPRAEQLYEITIEPRGGSPTGRPTGPILGKGLAKVPR